MPLDDKVEKMNGGVYGVLKCCWARQEIISQEPSIIDELRPIGRSHLYKQGGCSFLLEPMHL